MIKNNELKEKVDDARLVAMRKNFPRQKLRLADIPNDGMNNGFIRRQVINAMRRLPSSYVSQETIAKPGTNNDFVAELAYILAMQLGNPNGVDNHMFFGSWELEQEAKLMTAKLLNYKFELDNWRTDKTKEWAGGKAPEYVGGWLLNGGTESIIQASWIYRNKHKHTLRKQGWLSTKRMPKIVAPINSHLALNKAADLLGYGQDNIKHFYLKPDGRPDPISFKRTIDNLLRDGDEISMVWTVVGDTERGKFCDVAALDDILTMSYKKRDVEKPPILVDAAAQYLFAALMKDSKKYTDLDENKLEIPKWDFSVSGVKAIVTDPHKNQVPYPASFLLLADPQDSKFTAMDDAYLSNDNMPKEYLEHTQHSATIPTTRAGYGAAAIWAYYAGNGMTTLRKRKEKVWKCVSNLWAEIESGKLSEAYDMVCMPDSAVVPFKISYNWVEDHEAELENKFGIVGRLMELHDEVSDVPTPSTIDILTGKVIYNIYESIDKSPDHMFYIAKSEAMTAFTENDFLERNAKIGSFKNAVKILPDENPLKNDVKPYEYYGLIAHVMEHHTPKQISQLSNLLLREAEKLIK